MDPRNVSSSSSGKNGPRLSRPPLARMLKFHQCLAEGSYPNCQSLAAELEVSARTIQRDLDFLRDRMGSPIAYDSVKAGFYYTQPVTHFPGMEVSEGELVALLIAQKALGQHQGTSFERPLRAACWKLAESLRGRITVDWAELDAAISFRSAGVSRAEMGVFESVSRAVLESVEMSFEYKKLGSTRMETRRVRPYHLGCVENQWYLFAHDLKRAQLRTFALPRMRAVMVSPTPFVRPANFSIKEHLGSSFGVFSRGADGAVELVRIAFDPWAARLVGERIWHESQSIKPRVDGGIEVEFYLGSFEELERWVMSWGTHARVLAPETLRERIREIAKVVSQS